MPCWPGGPRFELAGCLGSFMPLPALHYTAWCASNAIIRAYSLTGFSMATFSTCSVSLSILPVRRTWCPSSHPDCPLVGYSQIVTDASRSSKGLHHTQKPHLFVCSSGRSRLGLQGVNYFAGARIMHALTGFFFNGLWVSL